MSELVPPPAWPSKGSQTGQTPSTMEIEHRTFGIQQMRYPAWSATKFAASIRAITEALTHAISLKVQHCLALSSKSTSVSKKINEKSNSFFAYNHCDTPCAASFHTRQCCSKLEPNNLGHLERPSSTSAGFCVAE